MSGMLSILLPLFFIFQSLKKVVQIFPHSFLTINFICYFFNDICWGIWLLLNIGYVSNETNADVRMYIEEFILVEI